MKQLARADIAHRKGEDIDPRFGELNRWTFLMMQIFESKTFLELAEGKFAVRQDFTFEELLVTQALFRAAIISYAKCFTQSGKNRSSLDKNQVFSGHSSELLVHERIIDLRHQYAAHNDASGLDEAVVDVQELPDKFIIGTQYAFAIPLNEYEGYQKAITVVEEYLVTKISKVTALLEVKLGKPIVNRNA